ncbi:MAG: hypothetical protein AAFX06_33140, partial [Planctomycetota bacterium]
LKHPPNRQRRPGWIHNRLQEIERMHRRAGRPSLWDDAPIIEVKAIACPACHATKLRYLKSTDNGDGSRTRRAKCVYCGVRFLVVIEPPDGE